MGVISNDENGIADPQLYELLLENFGSGRFGKRLRSEALDKIRELTVVNTQIHDLSFLRFFPSLIQLDVHANALTSLMGLGFVPQLRRLKLCDNPLTSLAALRNLKHLEVLDISNTDVSDISPLSEVRNLKMLRASNCRICDGADRDSVYSDQG